MPIDKSAKYTFTLQTTCGDIDGGAGRREGPGTVNSFKFLAGKGFFDHTRCHRLTAEGIYVLQCGDPTGQGNGGPGYTIADENLTAWARPARRAGHLPGGHDGDGEHRPAAHRRQPVLPRLQGQPAATEYTPFGTIGADGMKVLQKIAAAGGGSPARATPPRTRPW